NDSIALRDRTKYVGNGRAVTLVTFCRKPRTRLPAVLLLRDTSTRQFCETLRTKSAPWMTQLSTDVYNFAHLAQVGFHQCSPPTLPARRLRPGPGSRLAMAESTPAGKLHQRDQIRFNETSRLGRRFEWCCAQHEQRRLRMARTTQRHQHDAIRHVRQQ